MNVRFPWPALRLPQTSVPYSVEYERGVWGKVHAAPTDFRWIARSTNFGIDRTGLHQQLTLGAEDIPEHFQAWRNLDGRCYAVDVYPSRAKDATGRSGFLEKQILEWRRPAGMPAAFGALALLPLVASMTDAIWWDRFPVELAREPAFHLGIAPADHAPIAIDEEGLAAAIERGRQALRESVTPDVLAVLYEQILAGQKPAFLPGLQKPLPPEALAALLLPLPAEVADRISFAGWIPASRASMKDLAARWDVLVTSDQRSASIETVSQKARDLAAALLDVDEALPGEWLAGETPAPAMVAAKPSSSRPVRYRPGWKLELTPPEGGAPPIVRELYAFAVAPNRRWLAPSDLEHLGGPRQLKPRESAARVLCRWVQEVREQRPPYAAEAQWEVRVDLLRSAALVLAPDPATVRAVGRPGNESLVPSLLYALLLEKRAHRDALASLGETNLHEIIKQSVSCRGSRHWVLRVRQWLREWQVDTEIRAFDLRGWIGEALGRGPSS